MSEKDNAEAIHIAEPGYVCITMFVLVHHPIVKKKVWGYKGVIRPSDDLKYVKSLWRSLSRSPC